MFLVLAGSLLAFEMTREMTEVTPHHRGEQVIETAIRVGIDEVAHSRVDVVVEPYVEQKFRNIVRQAYDYSCGSAALTTLLEHYLGRKFNERQVMEGLLHYGESERIVERRGFSMLDMKRLVSALGYPGGGFRAEIEDLVALDHPAIVPIVHSGFKHFVVVRTIKDGRVFVADPSVGNISFTLESFKDRWDQNVLFVVFPGETRPIDGLELREEDLRFVDDSTITYQAFREFPQFNLPLENRIINELERMKNKPDGTVDNTTKQLRYHRK
ncbi:MAG: peptidase C39 [Proteobacteria bacterium]|nr:MAG: peptidase C39 [Pseudomonadota bacterium]